MWMFPEGTRSKKPELIPFKKGAFQVAVQNNLPIVPLVISPYSFIDDRKKVFGSGESRGWPYNNVYVYITYIDCPFLLFPCIRTQLYLVSV